MLFTLALGLFYLSRCLFNPFNTVWDVSDKIDGADFFFKPCDPGCNAVSELLQPRTKRDRECLDVSGHN